jgi:hypothetical protein
MVRKSLELANQPPLSDEDLISRSETWSETLWGILPEDEQIIFRIWRRAMADHQTTFPINAYDLKAAAVAVGKDDEAAVDQTRLLSATAPSQCLRCYGTGMERMYGENNEFLGTRKGCLHEHLDNGDPYAAGIDAVIAANKIVERERTSIEICAELRRRLAYQAVTSAIPEDANEAWTASKIL